MASSSSNRMSLEEFELSNIELPDDRKSEEQISREEMSENMLCTFNKTYDKLEIIWNKIGFSHAVREQCSQRMMCQVQEMLQDMVSEEECRLDKLKEMITISGQEILQLSDELSLTPYEPDISMAILDLENVLRRKADSLKVEKEQRMERLKMLKEEEHELCERLSMPPIPLSVCEVPSHEELNELDQHIKMLRDEKASRWRKFLNIQQEILILREELEIVSTLPFESEEHVHLSEEKLASLKELLQNLKRQKLESEQKAEDLRKRLSVTWQCIKKDEEERTAFLNINCGFKPSTIQLLQGEVERCENIKKQNLKQYVENTREDLKELWKKCCLSEDEIEKMSIMKDDTYTELMLDLHEAELLDWNRYYDQHADVLSGVKKLENLWTAFKVLEVRSQDPKRFANRGGGLLQEAKERKKLKKDLDSAEIFLRKKADEYKEQDLDFTIWGKELSEYVTNKRDTYNSEKASKSSRHKTQ